MEDYMTMTNVTIGLDARTMLLLKQVKPKNQSKYIRDAIAEKAQKELARQIDEYCDHLQKNKEDLDGFNKLSEEGWPD